MWREFYWRWSALGKVFAFEKDLKEETLLWELLCETMMLEATVTTLWPWGKNSADRKQDIEYGKAARWKEPSSLTMLLSCCMKWPFLYLCYFWTSYVKASISVSLSHWLSVICRFILNDDEHLIRPPTYDWGGRYLIYCGFYDMSWWLYAQSTLREKGFSLMCCCIAFLKIFAPILSAITN